MLVIARFITACDFGEKMRAVLDAERLARGWTNTVAMVGRFERMGEPLAYRLDDDATVVDVPLNFEAGERTGRVSFGAGGEVVGLFLRPAST